MPWLSWIISNIALASLLALAAWFAQRSLRWPAVARILWVLVLVKLVTPPLVSVSLRESQGMTACALGTCGCHQHVRTQSAIRDTFPWILLGLWSTGAAATGWTAWRRWTRFRRLMTHAGPAPQEWQSLVIRLASELSIGCSPEILAVPGRLSPMVVPGLRRPRLLLPMDLMDQLNSSQRAALVLHELVHIRRGDHWVRMLELTVGVVYWWLPLVGAIGRQLRACEESYCGAAVVAHLPHARRDYARLLLDVVDFTDPLTRNGIPQATAMSAAHDLEQRLCAILDATQVARRPWPAGVLVVCLACAALPCELRYDLATRPAKATVSAESDPAPEATPLPNGNREGAPLPTFCCPS